MRFATLDEWLSWQEQLHPRTIDLGLERVRTVLERLDLAKPSFRVLTIGGTNGKGSVAHTAANILQASGDSVGLYTSPHLARYNERIRVNGKEADDAGIVTAFDTVDQARGDISLTYFEFGTLAALEYFRSCNITTAVLEVGLGGRLDAVNALDADVAVVVSIGLDHVDWLGGSVEQIAREKAGIFRAGKPAVVGPVAGSARDSLRADIRTRGAQGIFSDEDFHWTVQPGHWQWTSGDREFTNLPMPGMIGAHQFANAAVAIAAVLALQADISAESVAAGIAATRIPGRLERVDTVSSAMPEIVLDVGHNAAAADAVAAALAAQPRPTRAVLGMLADKDAAAFVNALAGQVNHWYLAGLAGERGQSADALAQRLPADVPITGRYPDVESAVRAALDDAAPNERILVCGSFHTVGEFRASGLYSGLSTRSE
jgi:dihydrofolate synthase/folylpolyglutamate synthase